MFIPNVNADSTRATIMTNEIQLFDTYASAAVAPANLASVALTIG